MNDIDVSGVFADKLKKEKPAKNVEGEEIRTGEGSDGQLIMSDVDPKRTKPEKKIDDEVA